MTANINIVSTGADVATQAAKHFLDRLSTLLDSKPEAHVVLTGGSLGIASLAAIRESTEAKSIDFTRVHFWWGDERFVASDSADRNEVQARQALLDHLSIDEAKVHPFPSSDGDLSLADAKIEFTAELRTVFGAVVPAFDLVFLGMGPDGHIGSLFPGKPNPAAGELVVAESYSPKPPPLRLSFSYEVFNAAEEVIFVVGGADKAQAVAVAFGSSPDELPVGRVQAKKTSWFLDELAAEFIAR